MISVSLIDYSGEESAEKDAKGQFVLRNRCYKYRIWLHKKRK